MKPDSSMLVTAQTEGGRDDGLEPEPHREPVRRANQWPRPGCGGQHAEHRASAGADCPVQEFDGSFPVLRLH
jgi:hypothetical protein